jgi:streptogramin lyase
MGLLRYRPADGTWVRYRDELKIPNHAVLAVTEDSLGRLWIGTENGGLSLFDPATGCFYQYLTNPADPASLCFNTVYAITTDRDRNVWLATFAGVERVKNDKFTHVRSDFLSRNSLGSNNILSFCEDHLGTLWIGTDGEGLDRYDPKTGTFTHYKHDPGNPRSISSNAVTYLKEDRQGHLWIGTWGGGLNRFDRATGAFTRFRTDPEDPRSIGNDNIVHIYEDSRDNLWVGIGSGIELLDRRTGTFAHYNQLFPNTLLASYPGDILEDRSGTLWIGTYDGLCVLDRDRRTVRPFRHDDKDKTTLSSNVINTLFEDSRGNLWVGTTGGLNRMDRRRGTFRAFGVKDGLPSDAVYGILEDAQGFLWISTSNGVSKFDPAGKTFKNYGTDDGLQGNEFKQNAFLELKNGQMLFGGNNGYNVFNPLRITDNPTVPPVRITDFKLFNKPVPIAGKGSPLSRHISQTRELVLSHKHSVISFGFAALGYCYPEKNQYAYKLEGLEEDWNYVGNRREATYTSLDPGEYVLRVEASNNDGVGTQTGLRSASPSRPRSGKPGGSACCCGLRRGSAPAHQGPDPAVAEAEGSAQKAGAPQDPRSGGAEQAPGPREPGTQCAKRGNPAPAARTRPDECPGEGSRRKEAQFFHQHFPRNPYPAHADPGAGRTAGGGNGRRAEAEPGSHPALQKRLPPAQAGQRTDGFQQAGPRANESAGRPGRRGGVLRPGGGRLCRRRGKKAGGPPLRARGGRISHLV